MKERNINIDLIKSIACLGILGLHCIGYVNYTLYYICTFAVPSFFMVNGFLMFSKKEITLRYCVFKALSVLNIVVLWNIIISVPMMILKHKFINPLEQIYKSLIQQGYLWHFWFFGTLIILYLLLYPLYKLVFSKRAGLSIHIALCIVLFVLCICNTLYSYANHYPMCIGVPQSLRLWVSLFYFLLGGLIARIRTSNIIEKIPVYVPVILSISLGVVCNYGQKHLGLYGYSLRAAELFYDEFTVILWIISLFLLLLKLDIPVKLHTIIESFSRISLGIFIIHPLSLKASESIFIAKTTPQAIALWGGVLIISIIFSYCIICIPYIKKLVKL